MMSPPGDPYAWEVRVRLGPYPEGTAQRIARAVAPGSLQEVPRTEVLVRTLGPRSLEIRIRSASTSTLRAALNAYLRWIQLAERTEALASRFPGGGGTRARPAGTSSLVDGVLQEEDKPRQEGQHGRKDHEEGAPKEEPGDHSQ